MNELTRNLKTLRDFEHWVRVDERGKLLLELTPILYEMGDEAAAAKICIALQRSYAVLLGSSSRGNQ